MQIRRALQLLVLGLSAASVADATIVNPRLVRDGNAIQPRQATDDGDSNATPTNQPPATTPTAPPATPTPPTTPPAEDTSTTSRSTSAPVTSPTSSTPGGGTPEPTPTPSPPSRTSQSKSSSTTAPPGKSETREPVTETITTVVTSTNADGSKSTYTSEILTTSTPGLADKGSDNDSEKGLTKGERNTIIGVVVGVGGAIVLGALAFVAFRVWGRKKHQEESEELMDYTSTGIAEKPDGPGSQSGRSPFQSTLESYHAPGQVNTASNF